MGNTQRVIHNTLLLSIRMVLVMLVSLYTVRVTLDILGAVDYGIFNVVGGIVLLLNFLSRTMSSATQRFFSFELGLEEKTNLKNLFQTNLTIYLVLAVSILLFSVTVGMWFLNHKMVIPPERLNAANWVFVCAVFSFITRLLVIPYQAILIAHERMGLFAWLSIIEMIGLLIVVSILPLFSYDQLKSYAVLIFILNIIVSSLYGIICRKKYTACRWGINKNFSKMKTIVGFTGWSLYGGLALVLRNNGTNILLNLFFGPTINAARGIASQAQNAINTFVANFSVALKPQIVKNYANGNRKEMMGLIFQGSKTSYFIILFLAMPVLFQTSFFFEIWLKSVPDHTILFTRLVLITAIIDSITIPLVSAIEATGHIKKYQLISGSTLFLIIPISYFLLKTGMPPETPMVICVVIAFIIFLLNIYLAKDAYQLSVSIFFKKVVCRIITVTIAATLLPAGLLIAFDNRDGIIYFLLIVLSCMISTAISIYLLGLDKVERIAIKKIIGEKIRL